jgi:ribosomal protein S27E
MMMQLKPRIMQGRTQEEADVLCKARDELVAKGKTKIVCPRCGAKLAYSFGSRGEVTYCTDQVCGINIGTRGI